MGYGLSIALGFFPTSVYSSEELALVIVGRFANENRGFVAVVAI